MQRVEHHNSEPIDLDREQDPVKAIEIEVIKKLKDSRKVVRQIKVMKKVKGLTRSCTTT